MSDKNDRGFTLVEIILVALLVSFLGAVIYHVLAQGIRLWSRASQSHAEIEIYLGLEKMNDDLRNAFRYKDQKFKGTVSSIQFYTQRSNISVPGPAQVEYMFDSLKKEVRRSELSYAAILNKTPADTPESVVSSISNAAFSYASAQKKTINDWQLSWDDSCIPDAVKISIDYKERDQVKNISKTVILPTGGCAEI